MADVARSHGGDGGNEPPYGPPYNLRTGCESCYDNTERAKTKPPEGMNPDAWVRVIEELFTTLTYQKRSQANSANHSKQLYESYHGTQSYAQRR
ncbi:hypothetical protein R6Q57_000779 [Mikania cordata]